MARYYLLLGPTEIITATQVQKSPIWIEVPIVRFEIRVLPRCLLGGNSSK